VLLTLLTEHYLLQRAGDQHVAEVDILLQKRRDTAAARRFFKRVLASCPKWPSKNLDRPTPSVATRADPRIGQRQRRLRQTSAAVNTGPRTVINLLIAEHQSALATLAS
jgi:transposase-like protein